MAKGESVNENAAAGKLNSNKDLATILQSIASAKASDMITVDEASFTAEQGGLYLITASLPVIPIHQCLNICSGKLKQIVLILGNAKGAPDEIR